MLCSNKYGINIDLTENLASSPPPFQPAKDYWESVRDRQSKRCNCGFVSFIIFYFTIFCLLLQMSPAISKHWKTAVHCGCFCSQ